MADPFFQSSKTGSSRDAGNGYKSPLEDTLVDLRRKYVAAAGPQVGGMGVHGSCSTDVFLMEYSLLPSDGNLNLMVDENNMMINGNHHHQHHHYGYNPRNSMLNASMNLMPMSTSSRRTLQSSRNASTVFSPRSSNIRRPSLSSSFGGGVGADGTSDSGGSNISPRGLSHSHGHHAVHGHSENQAIPSSFLDQRAAFMECASRYRSGLASTSHEENLIACAPHLRHISAASAEMQGGSGIRMGMGDMLSLSMNNPLAQIMKKKRGTDGMSEPSARGSSTMATISDYRTCLARKHANHRVALELATFFRILANEMPLEEFGVVEGEVFSSILGFMNSSDNNKRLAGIAALDALIGVTSADEEKKATKFAKNLSHGLKAANVEFEFLSEVTRAVGKMAMGSANVDYVESEITRAVEWLKKERSDRRLAAVLTLKALAQNAPAAFYSKINQSPMGQEGTNVFITHLLPVLVDPQPIVRVCAADALAECLKVIVDPTRKHHSTTRLLCQVYSFILEGFNEESLSSQAETVAAKHASLLVLGDLVDLPLDFILPRFDEACQAALSLKDHPKALLRLEVIRLVPRLARRSPGPFRRRYLGTSLEYVMSAANNVPPQRSAVDHRPTAYIALGQLVLAVCEHESGGCYVPSTTLQFDDLIQADNSQKDKETSKANRRTVPYHMKAGDIHSNMSNIFILVRGGLGSIRTEALHCGADIIEALGPYAEPFSDSLLDSMFESGLSEDLISCLRSIAGSLPTKAYDIENRLLKELSLSLAGTFSVKDICDPLFASPYDIGSNSDMLDPFVTHQERTSPSIVINMRDSPEVIVKLELSLRTLRSFGNIQSRKGLSLLPFVRDVVAQYLTHPSQDVRREAALTCCFLLLPAQQRSSDTTLPPGGRMKNNLGRVSEMLLEEVLQKLLRVAVSDPSQFVRNCIVRAFDVRYDTYLSQTHHLPPLFLLLQDEALSVRASTLELLGRLARVNPAPILPGMRRILIQLITELKCSEDAGCGKEAATRLLIVFFKANALHRLVHPVLHSIIDVLPLKGNTPRVTTAALDALGELAKVVKEELNPWMHQLLPFVIESMQDHSSNNKQRTSLRALGQIAGSTGYVVDPYLDYPEFLSQAASVLPGAKKAPWALRQEIMRTFGILGALDPDHFSISDTARKGGGVGSGYFIATDEDHLDGNMNRNTTVGAISISKSFSNARRVEEVSMAKSDGRSPLDRVDVSKSLDESVTNRSLVRNDKDDDDEPAHLYMYELYAMTAQPVSKISPPRRLTPSDEEFYPTVSLQALTSILKNPSLIVYHQIAMTAIMFIFNSLGLRCVPFLKGIVPHILHTARTCGQTTLREALLQQIAKLSGIVRDNLSTYVPEIIDVVEEFWDSKHLSTVLDLIEKIAAGVPASFREYVPIIITRFLTTFDDFHSGSWNKGGHVSGYQLDRLRLLLQSIRNLRENLVEYIHLLLPAILKLTDALVNASMHFDGNIEQCQNLTIDCSKTVTHLLQTKTPSALKGQAEQMPALVAQPLIRMIGAKSDASKRVGLALIEALCLCAKKIGKSRWIPLYHISASNSILSWHRRFNSDVPNSTDDGSDPEKISSKCPGLKMYTDLIQSFLSTEESLDEDIESEDTERTQIAGTETSMHHLGQDVLGPSAPHTNQTNKHKVNQMNLKRAWDVSQKTTREDWDEWMRRFAIQLLREAPAPALRATGELAYAYQPLARELFSAAFTCCWKELSDQYKDSLIQALKTAFFSDASPEILQTLLNLAEYAERDGIPGGLPIEIDILAELALKCRSYAKALHYKEREHEMGGGGHCIEDLITINRKLDLPEAALGVLKAAQFELERNGVQSWDRLYYKSLKNKTRNAFSSRIFHRHQGQGLSFNVMATGSDAGAAKGGNWAGIEMQESWLAKLGSWSDALAMYESKLEESPSDIEAVLGCMNCLNARGEWRRVLELSNTSFEAFTSNEASIRDRRKAIKFCAQASWRLGKWDDFETFSSSLLENANDQTASMGKSRADFDGCFYSAILNIHRKEWSVAETFIDEARKSMDSRFTALMAESRKRAYPSMVTAQTLAEMEEIIAFRKLEERSKADASMHRANKGDVEDARARLVLLWRKRLAGCRVDAEVHSSILAVRSLVLGPTDEVEATLALSALSRQAQAYKLSERVLLGPLEQLGADLNSTIFGYGLPGSLGLGLLQTRIEQSDLHSSRIDNLVTGKAADYFPPYYDIHNKYCDILVKSAGGLDRLQVQHKLYFAYIKHLWAMRNRDEATNRLAHLAGVVDLVAHYHGNEMSVLRVSCWLKLAEWKIASSHTSGLSLPESDQYEVLMALKRSTFENMDGYKSWHTWALVNFRLAQQHDENRHNILKDSSRHSTPRPMYNTKFSKTMRSHAVAAVQGFVKAICLGTKRWSASVQQDLLNYLTCLFRYVQLDEVGAIINAEINTVALEAWLGVLPQLLARIHMKAPSVRSVLHPLLIRLGKKHPQALMYPLSVLVKSPVIERKEAAEGLMNSLKKHSYALVEDALMVSSELIRVAILWLELWHEGLEDASRLYFGEGNVSGMLDVLLPLHVALERGPSTRREQDFHTTFGRDLAEAHAYVKEYVRLIKIGGGQIPTQGGFMQPNETDSSAIPHAGQNVDAEYAMNQAWDLYYTVFRKINKQLPGLTTLELSHCSPALLQAHNLELGVPGSYRVDGSFVKIERFYPSVQVITSKQRPRKIVLRGGDGKDYVFLLKGHEDLRQDERVMQLFGLVNALLARDRRTNNHDLNIQRYTITPLSHNAGVVGWVPHCDTLHSLIRDYRAQKRVTLNMENRQMLKLAQDYELLTVMQKVEIFSEALDRTTGKGNDIHEVLWIKSTNSEEWLDRRTKFTRSIAVMSMVGYILGLGDRHPSNLLLGQISGRVLHIDFGDCFEVAMHREKYPEKVPFRLTRMLIKAMEVSGIEGSYRDTCERTMGVLHDNRDTLVAMLEAFVYDPLISWRLLGQSGTENNQYTAATEQEVQNDLGIESATMIPVNERLGRSMVHSRSMVNAPICEDSAEEGNEEERSASNPFLPVQRNFSSGNPANPGSLHNSQMRSLKMYSEIQTLASNLNVSSRIASIAGDGTSSTVRNLSFAAESLSRSRLDRSVMQREVMGMSMAGDDTGSATEEALNEKALKVIRRVQDKLTGTDFHPPDEDVSAADPLDVEDQVQRLIVQATSTENLCQLFIGWCAFW